MIETPQQKIPLAAWLAFLTGCLLYLYQYVLRIVPGVLSSTIQETYHIPATAIGAVSGAYFWAYTPMQIPAGIVTDQFGPRRLLLLATAILTISVFGEYAAERLGGVVLFHYMIGFASAFVYIGTTKLAANWFPARHFGTLVGVITAFGMLGSAFGSNALLALSEEIGISQVVLGLGIAGALLLVVAYLFVKDSPSGNTAKPDKKIDRSAVSASLGEVVREPGIWTAGSLSFVLTIPAGVVAGFAGVTILTKLHGASVQDATLINSMIFIGTMVGAPVVPAIAAALGKRREVLMTCLALAGIGLAGVILLPELPRNVLMGLFLLIGFSAGASAIAMAMGKESVNATLAGMAVAVVNMCGMTAPMTLQPWIGRAMDGDAAGLRDSLSILPSMFLIALAVAYYGNSGFEALKSAAVTRSSRPAQDEG